MSDMDNEYVQHGTVDSVIKDEQTFMACDDPSTLILEPFYGGSHKQLVDILLAGIPKCELLSQPAKKWQWKARTSALWFAQNIQYRSSYKALFASSMLNLAELVAIRPDLATLHKVIYFHENQLVYPVRKQQERDFQFGYNQIITCLAADVVLFNSKFNMESFLSSINTFLKLIPDHRPKGVPEKIRPKCDVVYFPLALPKLDTTLDTIHKMSKGGVTRKTLNEDDPCLKKLEDTNTEQQVSEQTHTYSAETLGQLNDTGQNTDRNDSTERVLTAGEIGEIQNDKLVLHILWPHRWEHDKDPSTFFTILFELKELGCKFKLSVLGETFATNPDIFQVAKERLEEEILHWGFLQSKEEYYNVLCQADVVVSTALHEFFGVAMLEAVHCGCYALCPNRLVYPEIFPSECLYNTTSQLSKKLKEFCIRPYLPRKRLPQVNLERYSWNSLRPAFLHHLEPRK